MNAPATIEAEAPPETLLVEEALTEELLADGEPPVLTEEAMPEVAFSRRPDRLLRLLVCGFLLVFGAVGGAVLVHIRSGSQPDAAATEGPAPATAVTQTEDAAASRKPLEDVATVAEGSNEAAATQGVASVDKPAPTQPVVEPATVAAVDRAPMTALEAAVAAGRTPSMQGYGAHQGARSLHQIAAKPVKTAECSLKGNEIATFRSCVEKFNQ